MAKRKQKPRTTMAHKKAVVDAAVSSLPGRQPGDSMYAAWKALGFEDKPATADDARPYDDLAAALKTAITSHDRMRGPTETSEHYPELAARIIEREGGELLKPPFKKSGEAALEQAMTATGITPLPAVDTFIKWLRRRAAE